MFVLKQLRRQKCLHLWNFLSFVFGNNKRHKCWYLWKKTQFLIIFSVCSFKCYTTRTSLTDAFHRMTKKTVIIRTALNSTFNYRISVCELLQTDDSIASINSAITTLRATITQRELWCGFAGHCMSPQILHKIHRDVSEISIVSSWALTVVFHCEYQPRRWWISPFSSDLVTNSYRPLWCQSQSVGSRYHEHDCC